MRWKEKKKKDRQSQKKFQSFDIQVIIEDFFYVVGFIL
jgi:hypothetical protein